MFRISPCVGCKNGMKSANGKKAQFKVASREFSHDKKNFRKEHYVDHKHHKDAADQLAHNKHDRENEKGAVLEFDITPIGTDETSLANYAALSAKVLKHSGLKHEMHAMGTIVEGPLHECFDAVSKCVEAALKKSPRVVINIRGDVEPGNQNTIHSKNAKLSAMMSHIEPNERL